MKATVYFIELTEELREALNKSDDGWDCPVGRAYLAAKDGRIDGSNFDMLIKAATGDFDNSEHAWKLMQNGVVYADWSKTDLTAIRCYTEFPRSMDVGDIIVWENGWRERVAACGFEKVV